MDALEQRRADSGSAVSGLSGGSSGQGTWSDGQIRIDVRPGGVPAFLYPLDPRLAQDFDIFVDWFSARKADLDILAAKHGALLFRGFPLKGTEDFQRSIQHYPTNDMTYIGGVAPRGQLAERVFESTRAPKEWNLILHQEMAYLPRFPRMVAFFSKTAAWAGGETILADFRDLESRLPRRLWDQVKARGVCYERNFRASEDVQPWRAILHKTWTEAFGTDDPARAEEACRSVGLEPVWQDDGSLSTFYTSRGFMEHPLTGQTVWFNHIASQTMNQRTLGPQWADYANHYGDHLKGPFNPTYGDGQPFDPEDLEALYRVLDSLIQACRWQAGDLLLVDNILTAHGRNPYEGQREVQVALLG
jgi:alpha-ketoglutarate-dependent taurine dioxygenase